jgi:hypothetical protein
MSSLEGRTWIQKGGAGRGGETQIITFDDFNSLLNQRLVYRSKHSFPTATADITESGIALLAGTWTDEIHQKVAAILNDKGVPLSEMADDPELPPTEHPSYGQISISHINGGHDELYGATIKHPQRICLRVQHSKIHRQETHESYMDGSLIVELDLAYDQFVGMLFNANRGSGVPCTIRNLNGESIPGPSLTTTRSNLSKKFKQTIIAVTENVATLQAEATRILKTPGALKADDKTYLLNILTKLTQDVRSNIPFYEKTFQENMDKTISEIEIQLDQRAASLGLKRNDTPKLLG